MNGLFLLIHFLLWSRNLLAWFLLTLPALVIEIWFERIARPTHGENGELKRAGEDLEAKGLTEWMWDVLYWTWGCEVLVCLLGTRAWWAYLAVPTYSAYLAFTTFTRMRQGFSGLGENGSIGGSSAGSQSNRQTKMEKRGGQRVQYR